MTPLTRKAITPAATVTAIYGFIDFLPSHSPTVSTPPDDQREDNAHDNLLVASFRLGLNRRSTTPDTRLTARAPRLSACTKLDSALEHEGTQWHWGKVWRLVLLSDALGLTARELLFLVF